MSYIYLASPYSSGIPKGEDPPIMMVERFSLALRTCVLLIKEGLHPYSPIVNCHLISTHHGLPHDATFWNLYNKSFLSSAASLFILCIPGWNLSEGVSNEWQYAKSYNVPIRFVTLKRTDHPLGFIADVQLDTISTEAPTT